MDRVTLVPQASEYRAGDVQYFRELVLSTGLTRVVLARDYLGVTDRCLRLWMAGDTPFPYSIQFTLECIVLGV